MRFEPTLAPRTGRRLAEAARAMTLGLALLALVLVAVLAGASGGVAAQGGTGEAQLTRFLEQVAPGALVPGAERYGTPEGSPPMVPALGDGEVLGYVYLTSDVVNTTGYSGKPIRTLVGLDPDGTIVGTELVEHHEPIVLIGIPESRIEGYLDGFLGFNPLQAAARGESAPEVDIVSGATVTVLVIGDGVVRSAGRMAARLAGQPSGPDAAAPDRVVDPEGGSVADWQTLLGNGAVRRLAISVAEVNRAFERSGNAKAARRPEKGAPDDAFVELYVALVSQPAIGRSLLGEAAFERLGESLAPGQEAILVMGGGRYSFKGSGYVRGGVFDRIEVTQGTETLRFRDRQHQRIADLAAEGAPSFKEIALFTVPEDALFAPAEPWTLQLLVQRAVGALDKAFVSFALDYRLPDPYAKTVKPAPAAAGPEAAGSRTAASAERASAGEVAPERAPAAVTPPASETPLWQRIWRSKIASISLLGAMLLALTAIFFFQDVLVKREKLFDRIRLGYLLVTLFWLGWVAQAQLSVVNVLAFANALRTDFQWSYFLVDPLIFILWFAVAASLLFWGRGPFCGWLCPFGALQ